MIMIFFIFLLQYFFSVVFELWFKNQSDRKDYFIYEWLDGWINIEILGRNKIKVEKEYPKKLIYS